MSETKIKSLLKLHWSTKARIGALLAQIDSSVEELGLSEADVKEFVCFARENPELVPGYQSTPVDAKKLKAHVKKQAQEIETVPGEVTAELYNLPGTRLIGSMSDEAYNNCKKTFSMIEGKGMDKLSEWLTERQDGIKPDLFNVAVGASKDNEEERYVYALKDIPQNKLLMRISLSDVISDTKIVNKSSIGKAIIKAIDNNEIDTGFLSTSKFSAFLASERLIENSPWAPYLNVLPTNFSTMPICWNKDEKQMLKGTMTANLVKKMEDSLYKDYAAISEYVLEKNDEFKKFSFADFIWAHCVVISRTFVINVDSVMTRLLVPYGDMFNHDDDQETAAFAYDPRTKSFFYFTCAPAKAGKELFTTYGLRCNSEMLLGYGFCIENNIKYNRGEVTYQFDDTIHKFNLTTTYTDNSVLSCMTLLRMILCPDPTLPKLVRKDNGMPIVVPEEGGEVLLDLKTMRVEPISVENELSCLEQLKNGCIATLSVMNSSEEEDIKLMKSTNINEKNAAMIRTSEREVLNYWINLVDTISEIYSNSSSWPEFTSAMIKRFLSSYKHSNHFIAHSERLYISEVWEEWLKK